MRWYLLFAVVLIGWSVACWALRERQKQPLLDYVHRDDGAFAWEKVSEQTLSNGLTLYELKLTSQRWKDMVWTHRLWVAKPPKVTTQTALLVITGGRTGDKGGSDDQMIVSTVAAQLQAVIAMLFHVPNQPLFDNLFEDDIIAHTFVQVLQTNDPEWAALLPMTKSAVKAMDAVQQFADKELGIKVDSFVVTGGSKRGWTTWLSAVVDPKRVKGIAPMVYDNLNIPAQMRHQREVFGGYSEMIAEYTKRGLTDLAEGEKARPLVQLVDPYFYLERLKMPKLIINGTNDRYWALDAANFYFDDLLGKKQILIVPNSGHGLEDRGRVFRTLFAFFNCVVGRISFPNLNWQWKQDESRMTLEIKSEPQPKQILLWTAQAPTKDFRDARWESKELTISDGAYRFTLKPLEKGYLAAFAEVVYEVSGHQYSVCTTVRIVGK